MAFFGTGGRVAGLTCPHCGENQGRPLSTVPGVLYCRKCSKSFTRRMGEGLHQRSPKRKALTKLTGPSSVLPAKRPSTLPSAPPPSALK